MSYIDSTSSPCCLGPFYTAHGAPEVPKMPGAFLETSKAKAGKVGEISSSFETAV